ncbi:MAG: S41 family peptidase [Bacteroidales bacterium]|jgi:carboxyl-terminal processing protease|nr:S41 family peptidase [Bacteroidales bacterium]
MKSSLKTLLIIAVSLLAGIIIGWLELPIPSLNTDSKQANGSKLQQVLQIVSDNYVDKINNDTLTDETINGMLSNLDPHSVYLTAAEVKRENESLNGHFDGIGIQFHIVEDTIVVIQPVKGGPSAKVGIMAGDRIVKINDTNRTGAQIDNDKVLKLLKGAKGTKVKLSIKRAGVDKLIDFVVKRNVIETKSVDYSGMIDGDVGYIKLSAFSATAFREVSKALSDLRYNYGCKKLIFDLRGNGGGYLQEAIAIADEFLPKKDLIVFTKGRDQKKKNIAYATSGGFFEKGELIILIDETSASASEILAGAIQDNDRGKIIGRRSFGKGLVQEQFSLTDGSVLRLTISRYYTPSGRCIQRPYTTEDPNKYYEDFLARYVSMETGSDTLVHTDSLRYKTKNGRYVYGGGGIEPDIRLPYINYKRSPYYDDLIRSSLIYKYCFDYADKNRKSLKQFPNGNEFINKFKISTELLNEFKSYAAHNGIPVKPLPPQDHKRLVILMKAYIAQLLYDDQCFYKLYLTIDDDVQKALHYL